MPLSKSNSLMTGLISRAKSAHGFPVASRLIKMLDGGSTYGNWQFETETLTRGAAGTL